ncbi:MAG: hypothetical protein GX829_09120 [Clostridium sp.]|nr:hypothetical protein [Clostridium sp.]
MIKLLNTSDLSLISYLEKEVQTYSLESLTILDEEYGTERDPITDLGGYIAIVEHPSEIEELEQLHHCDLTKNPCPEYVDFIITEHGPLYIASLFLLSSDYGIIMILPYEITPKEILKK